MVRITIDDELKQKLQAAEGTVVLCDADGKTIGLVNSLPEEISSLWEMMPAVPDDEIQRRLNSPEPGLTTAELKASLRDLS